MEGNSMQEALLAGFAVVAGILLGFWLRGVDARAERATLEERNHEFTEALLKARNELAQHAADGAARAGFESLATEREKTITLMTTEQERLRTELQAKAEAER